MPKRRSAAYRHKTFYRNLEALLDDIDRDHGLEKMVTTVLERVTSAFDERVGLVSGRLYRRDEGAYEVVRSFGAKGKAILGYRVPDTYAVFESLERDTVTHFNADDGLVDPEVEVALGVGEFAAFRLGPDDEYVASFGLRPDADVDEAMLILNTLRYALQHRIEEEHLEGQIQEARAIQVSLLPGSPPVFEGYELVGRSRPAEAVGGDVFDFLPIDAHLLGVAIGDASGHGVPAALQARDVVTGLRMGVQRDLKITSVVGKLNRVIHQSGLTSRFISLLYGELEESGNFVYVNAGHDPGLLLRVDGSVVEMRSTGIVLGPLDDVEYRREFVTLAPGDTLLLYTDGLVERVGPADEEYGRQRAARFTLDALSKGIELEEIAESLIEDAFVFGRKAVWSDDVTVVLVRRRFDHSARRP